MFNINDIDIDKIRDLAMNFKLDDNSLGKIIDMSDHIGKILNIDLYHYSYDGNNRIP